MTNTTRAVDGHDVRHVDARGTEQPRRVSNQQLLQGLAIENSRMGRNAGSVLARPLYQQVALSENAQSRKEYGLRSNLEMKDWHEGLGEKCIRSHDGNWRSSFTEKSRAAHALSPDITGSDSQNTRARTRGTVPSRSSTVYYAPTWETGFIPFHQAIYTRPKSLFLCAPSPSLHRPPELCQPVPASHQPPGQQPQPDVSLSASS